MKFVFHLGTYKTGTSSLQNFLFENRATLKERGLCYPKAGVVESTKLGFRHRRIVEEINLEGRTNLLNEVMEEAEAAGCQTVFLSSEAWSRDSNLSALTTAVHALKDLGVSDFNALVTFRNVADYQVSHYREFTLNQRNLDPYARYASTRRSWVNYVLLLQNFRALFGDRLKVLHYEDVTDSRVDVLRALGLESFVEGLAFGDRANVKSTGALEVEAVRVARRFNLHPDIGREALAKLLHDMPAYKSEVWTERFEGDITPFGAAYREAFRDLSGWAEPATDALFHIAPVHGRNVETVTEMLVQRLTLPKPKPRPSPFRRVWRKIFAPKA